MEPIEAEWRPIVDARPPRTVTWVDVWRGAPWMITVGGVFVLLMVLSFLWGVLVGW